MSVDEAKFVSSALDVTISDEWEGWYVDTAEDSSDGSSVYPEQSKNKSRSLSEKSEKVISDGNVVRGLTWVTEEAKSEVKGMVDKNAAEGVSTDKTVQEKDFVLNSARGNKTSLGSFVVANDKRPL